MTNRMDGYNDVFNCVETATPTFAASVTEAMLTNLYLADDIARRIVDVVPEECARAGFQLEGVSDKPAFESVWDEKGIGDKLVDAMCWDRLFGGAGVVAIVKDGRNLKNQVGENAELESIRVYDRNQITISKREQNVNSERFGMPLTYKIAHPGVAKQYEVHHSRIHILDGDRVPVGRQIENSGFGQTVLHPTLIESINDYNKCQRLASALLKRKQQGVWKVKGLAEVCDDDEGRMATRTRLAQVDQSGGVGNTIGIDANEEDYEILNSDISGVKEFLDGKLDRIVTNSGIHEIVLKNKNVGGMNSSQNTALESFNKLVDRKRKDVYKPLLEFVIKFMVPDDEWTIEFNPLAVPSDEQISVIFERDVKAITMLKEGDMITLDEVRETLKAGKYGLVINDGADKILLDKEKENDEQASLAVPGNDQEPTSNGNDASQP